MLPVTHGVEFTRLHILLYTILLVLVTLLPYLTGMTGLIYLAAAVLLGAQFLYYAIALQRHDAPRAPADARVPLLDHLPDAAVRGAARRPLPADAGPDVRAMASRSHFAAPLLLAVVVALIVYVSLYPFRFAPGGPSMLEALDQPAWARAGRSEMLNNVLLYLPFGFCLALLVEPRFGRVAALARRDRRRRTAVARAWNCCRPRCRRASRA